MSGVQQFSHKRQSPCVKRKCLKCDKKFDSWGDRLCDACHKINAAIADTTAAANEIEAYRYV
jgi:hypothetical protein